jgi:hypothetical protein
MGGPQMRLRLRAAPLMGFRFAEGSLRERHAEPLPGIRAVIDEHATPLTICGHFHWESPLCGRPGGQILNVDFRVIVLTRG